MDVETRRRVNSTANPCPYLGSHDGADVCLSREDDVLVISPRYVETYCQTARHVDCSLYQHAEAVAPLGAHRADMERVPVAETAGLAKSWSHESSGGGEAGGVTVQPVMASEKHAAGEEPEVFPSEPRSSGAVDDTETLSSTTTESAAANRRPAGKEEPTLVETQPVVMPDQRPARVESVTLEPSETVADTAEPVVEAPAFELRPESKGEAGASVLEAEPAGAAGSAAVEEPPDEGHAALTDRPAAPEGRAMEGEAPDSEAAANAAIETRSVLSSAPPRVGQDLLTPPGDWSTGESVPAKEPVERVTTRRPILAAIVIALLCLGAGAALLGHFSGGATRGPRPTSAPRPALVGSPRAHTVQTTPIPKLAPALVWHLPRVSTPVDQAVLVLTNPNSLPVGVSIRTANGSTVLVTSIPARNGAEVDLAPPDAHRGLTVRATRPIFLQRTLIRQGRVESSQAGQRP